MFIAVFCSVPTEEALANGSFFLTMTGFVKRWLCGGSQSQNSATESFLRQIWRPLKGKVLQGLVEHSHISIAKLAKNPSLIKFYTGIDVNAVLDMKDIMAAAT